MIIKGDQYKLPVTINLNGTAVTPDDVTDVRIQIGSVLKSYAAGEITYNTTSEKWEYPITEDESRDWGTGVVPLQVGVKVSTDYKYSTAIQISIGQNIITEGWDE